jgi:hypothetical protein
MISSSSSSFTMSSTPMPSSVVVIGFLGGEILCCGVRVGSFFSLVLFFCDYWGCPRSRSMEFRGF